MIPKNIFTTWISDKAAPDIFYKCFESWHRLMPDWNIHIISKENVCKDAYILDRLEDKNYVMASHYARVYELLQSGGIYVDIDVEANKNFEILREHSFFCGHQGGGQTIANNAVMGCEPGHQFAQEMLDYVEAYPVNGCNAALETGPHMITNMLKEKGWDGVDDFRCVNDITVYPSPYFYPFWYGHRFTPGCVKPETIMTHHWAESWRK